MRLLMISSNKMFPRSHHFQTSQDWKAQLQLFRIYTYITSSANMDLEEAWPFKTRYRFEKGICPNTYWAGFVVIPCMWWIGWRSKSLQMRNIYIERWGFKRGVQIILCLHHHLHQHQHHVSGKCELLVLGRMFTLYVELYLSLHRFVEP